MCFVVDVEPFAGEEGVEGVFYGVFLCELVSWCGFSVADDEGCEWVGWWLVCAFDSVNFEGFACLESFLSVDSFEFEG